MTWFHTLQKLSEYNLRKHDGFYTLEFSEGRHRIQFHRHDTGQHIKIWVMNGEELLFVYERTEWFSPRYEFNGFGRGWIHRGPWVLAIARDFSRFEDEIEAYEERRETPKDAAEKARQEAEKETLHRFSALYDDGKAS